MPACTLPKNVMTFGTLVLRGQGNVLLEAFDDAVVVGLIVEALGDGAAARVAQRADQPVRLDLLPLVAAEGDRRR